MFKLLRIFLPTMFAVFAGCASTQKIDKKNEPTITTNACTRAVRYYIDNSISITEGGAEKEDNTAVEMIIDPIDGQLTMMHAATKEYQKQAIKLERCNLSEDMKSGQAVFTMLVDKLDGAGNTTVQTISITIEAVGGTAFISLLSPNKTGGLKSTVKKWEYIN